MQACLEIILGWIKKNVKNYTCIVRCFVYPKEYSLGNHQWHKWAVKFQVIGRGIGGLATFTTIKRHRRLINHTMKKKCIQTANRSATTSQTKRIRVMSDGGITKEPLLPLVIAIFQLGQDVKRKNVRTCF